MPQLEKRVHCNEDPLQPKQREDGPKTGSEAQGSLEPHPSALHHYLLRHKMEPLHFLASLENLLSSSSGTHCFSQEFHSSSKPQAAFWETSNPSRSHPRVLPASAQPSDSRSAPAFNLKRKVERGTDSRHKMSSLSYTIHEEQFSNHK